MKRILLYLLLSFPFCYSYGQKNPYTIFESGSKLSDGDIAQQPFRVKNSASNSKVKFLEFDLKNHSINLLDEKESIIETISVENDKLLRFISVDPITRKYPELTPYQFASNSPISGIDRDGLEYFYYSDGKTSSKLGQLGSNTEVMLINSSVTIAKAREMFSAAHNGASDIEALRSISKDVRMTNEELNTRAVLSTLKQTENHGEKPLAYNAWNGFNKDGSVQLFTKDSYTDNPGAYAHHPGANPNNHNKRAAGAYQIMLEPTWNNSPIRDLYGLKEFSPINQDKFIIQLIRFQVHGLTEVKSGDINSIVEKLRGTWRSLPGPQTQDNLTMKKVSDLFQQNITNELNGNSNLAIPVGTTLNNLPKVGKQ